MSTQSIIRLLSALWLCLAASIVLLPAYHGWRGWPPEAIAYVKWYSYSAQPVQLPFALKALGLSLLFFVLGAISAWKWPRVGATLHLMGLGALAYWNVSDVPAIRDSFESTLYGCLFLISGAFVTTCPLATTRSSGDA
jgi:hypothetical protein